MKKLILSLAMASLASVAIAATDNGCDAGCQQNVQAVFRAHTSYTMHVDDGQRAHISVTWTAKHHHEFRPVTMVGVAPVRLRDTTLNRVEFADTEKDPCHAVITVLAQRGGDVDAYRIPVRNVLCHS